MNLVVDKGLVKNKGIGKLAFFSLIVSLSVIFSAVEELYFVRIPVPGVKYGLGNIPLLFGALIITPIEIYLIVLLKILIHSLLFYGFNPISIWFSLAGGLASATVLIFLKSFSLIDISEDASFRFSLAGTGALMGSFHITFQILAAYFVLRTEAVFLYLPLAGVLSVLLGFAGGVISNYIAKKLRYPDWERGF